MTPRLRDAQLDALRCDQIARNICSALEQKGEESTFDPRTRLLCSTDPVGHTWRYQLGTNGKVESITTPTGRRSDLTCDDHGRIVALREPSGQHTQVPCDEQGAPYRFVRNDIELVRFSWEQQYSACLGAFWDGTRAQISYTAQGKPSRYVNRLSQVTAFEYGETGRLTSLSDGSGQLTRFEYDELGRPSATSHPDGRVESLAYPAPRKTIFAQGSSQLLELDTDARQQPVAAAYADGSEYAFAYDDAGRLVEATGPEGAGSYQYREDGKLLSETSGDQTFSFEYDSLGLLQAIVYPDGTRAEFAYDPDRRLATANWAGGSLAFSYDKQDLKRTVRTPRLEGQVEHDTSGKPSRIAVIHSDTRETAFESTYCYDAQSRLIAKTDSEFGEQVFAYDPESQLVGVANGRGQWRETFTYDAAGNRTFTSGCNVELAPGNRVLAQGDVRCEYDARGNLVTLGVPGQGWRFHYDLKNQLVEANGPSGTIEFKYDALGRRIEKRSPDRTIRYVWCGELLTRELITTGTHESVRDYLYHPGSYEPLAQRVDGRLYYYHNDHLGTPQRLTDDQGQVVWAAEHFAFGFAQVKVGLVENPLRFLGQYADIETGLYYNRFRYYSPVLGRYMSVDPAGLLGGHNLYLYANNDPINRSDPLGLFSWGAFGVAAAAAVATAACVILAPAAAAIAVVAVGALALGAVIGVGIVEYQSIDKFCWACFWRGAGNAAPTAFGLGLGLGALCVLCPPVGLALAVGGAVYGTYALFDSHFGWSGSKPFDQMTDDEKSEHLGGLAGGTVAGIAGGVAGGAAAGAAVEAVPALGRFAGPRGGAAPGETERPVVGGKATPEQLDGLYGAPKEPGGRTGIKDFELNPDGSVVKNPTIQYPEPGKPPVLEPGKDYIWLVDDQGRLVVAEEVPTGKTLPDGRPERLGHPTLVDGKPARIGGEIKAGPDGQPIINNRSGRFSGHPDRGPAQLDNAAKLFEDSGMPVGTDFSPPLGGPPPAPNTP